VFIDEGNLQEIQTNYCADAIAIKREKTGVDSVQVASFTNKAKAEKFAQFVGGEVSNYDPSNEQATVDGTTQGEEVSDSNVVNGRTPEEDLAIIDRNPSNVEQYRNLLDEVEQKCDEPRRSIADMTAKGVEIARSEGANTNNLDMLNGLRIVLNGYPTGEKHECAQDITALVIVMTKK